MMIADSGKDCLYCVLQGKPTVNNNNFWWCRIVDKLAYALEHPQIVFFTLSGCKGVANGECIIGTGGAYNI